ncbi:MAG: hypothetical protein IGQ88_10400 [Gloeomargaritaceae cyanobacterium C42_A2020_066]|nr:hypothetical protein [Gloeomargaritaceae cyanobacterium C42_A2020_066]
MARSKLTLADREAMARRYQEAGDTVATLAAAYGVSSSTVIRLLREVLTESVYESLAQQRRGHGRRPAEAGGQQMALGEIPEAPAAAPEPPAPKPLVVARLGERLARKRSQLPEQTDPPEVSETPRVDPPAGRLILPKAIDLRELGSATETPEKPEARPAADALPETPPAEPPSTDTGPEVPDSDTESSTPPEQAALSEAWDDQAEGGDSWEDGDDDDDAEFASGHEPDLSAGDLLAGEGIQGADLRVETLTSAVLPKSCFLVVDRFDELVTRPLQDFGDLGPLPADQTESAILPVFDNSWAAKRFMRRGQRLLKVPSGQLLHPDKTGPYLLAKGISHLLMNGQIYRLEPDAPLDVVESVEMGLGK